VVYPPCECEWACPCACPYPRGYAWPREWECAWPCGVDNGGEAPAADVDVDKESAARESAALEVGVVPSLYRRDDQYKIRRMEAR
jgi:hypothetical protein